MNTNEIQQVMENNEQYMSLYEYKGHGSRQSGLGKQVNSAAKAAGIKIIYRPLPEHLVQQQYKSVATYPKSFLDAYFGIVIDTTQNQALQSLKEIKEKIKELTLQLDETINKLGINDTNSYERNDEPDEDDLPF
jgi:signal recognition particle subunit SEC65